MVLKAQQLASHPLVRSPAMSKEEAVAAIPNQPARQPFRRVALDPTPVLMLFVCLLFSLLGESSLVAHKFFSSLFYNVEHFVMDVMVSAECVLLSSLSLYRLR